MDINKQENNYCFIYEQLKKKKKKQLQGGCATEGIYSSSPPTSLNFTFLMSEPLSFHDHYKLEYVNESNENYDISETKKKKKKKKNKQCRCELMESKDSVILTPVLLHSN